MATNSKSAKRLFHGRTVPFETPWFRVEEKYLDDETLPYYALQLPDYVTVLATTGEGNVVLIRQFRPAVERETIELPAGHLDPEEAPETAARRELLEETGYAAHEMVPLPPMTPDCGRLANRLWGFYAPNVSPSAQAPESGIQVDCVSPGTLGEMLADGRFDHSLHLAVILQVVAKGLWSFPRPNAQ